MNKITPFVISRIESKLLRSLKEKGACAELRAHLYNSESDNGLFALNTIKRWFGIIEPQVEPSAAGLEAIARYLNYPSWHTLTMENAYTKKEEKSEEEYIGEFFSDYSKLSAGIRDYTVALENVNSKDQKELYQSRIKQFENRRQAIKDAIVSLAQMVTDSSSFVTNMEEVESLYKKKNYVELNRLLNEDELLKEQRVLMRALRTDGADMDQVRRQLKSNARLFYLKGILSKINRKPKEAIRFYKTSLQSKEDGLTLFALADAYTDIKQDDKALSTYRKVDKFFKNIVKYGDVSDVLSYGNKWIDSFYNSAKIYATRDSAKFLELMNMVIGMCNEIIKGNDDPLHITIAHAYNEMGNHVARSDYNAAIAYYSKSLDIYKRFSQKDYDETLINLSYVHCDLKEFEIAEENINNALANAREYLRKEENDDIDNRMRVAKVFFAKGFLFEKKEEYHLSVTEYKRAILVFEQVNAIQKSLEAKNEICMAYDNIERIYRNKLNDPEKADEYYKLLNHWCYLLLVPEAEEKKGDVDRG